MVAKKLGRKYFGIEKDKKYFKAANERINKTKAIEENYLDTIENNKSKPRIPFGSLVELGILKPGTTLFDPKKKINARIMADGSIKYKSQKVLFIKWQQRLWVLIVIMAGLIGIVI